MTTVTAQNWRATKFKFVGVIISGGTPESGKADYWDGPVPWLTPVDLGKNGSDAISGSGRTITHAGVAAAGLYILPPGSIVISTRAPIGSVGLLACGTTTNQGCKAIVPDVHKFDSKFAYYFALDAAQELQSLGLGTTFVELSTYSLKNFTLSVPDVGTQQRIAKFLDEQTAKIDRLMALRRRQMELLREQRAALIQQAVTRGLNPNAPLKDSGIPWLGQIPAHWTVLPLKRWVSSKITDGPHETPELIHSGVDFVSAEAVQDGRIYFESRRGFISVRLHEEYCRKCKPQRNDIFFVKSGATTGKLAIIDTDNEFSIWSPLALIRADASRILPSFLFEALQTEYVQSQVKTTWSYGTQPNISMAALERIVVAAPSLDEQIEILNALQDEVSKFDALHSGYSQQLALLAEYRAALIHECVTGQRPVGTALPAEAASA